MLYQGQASSSPGGLLRLLLEEQSKNPTMVGPGSDPSAIMRGAIIPPVSAPESPGTSRMVSFRPEGVTQQGPEAGGVGNVVPPASPVMPAASPVVGPSSFAGSPTSGGFTNPGGGSSTSSVLGESARGVSVKGPVTSQPVSPAAGFSPAYSSYQSYKPITSSAFSTPQRTSSYTGALGGAISQVGKKILPELGTKILPNIAKAAEKFSPYFAAFENAANILKQQPWLLKPGGTSARAS